MVSTLAGNPCLKAFRALLDQKRNETILSKEIYLNLSSRVVLSNRITYIISPIALLLQETN